MVASAVMMRPTDVHGDRYHCRADSSDDAMRSAYLYSWPCGATAVRTTLEPIAREEARQAADEAS